MVVVVVHLVMVTVEVVLEVVDVKVVVVGGGVRCSVKAQQVVV